MFEQNPIVPAEDQDEKKLRMLKAAGLPTLLLGSAAWTPVVKQLKWLQSFIMRCLRVILGVLVREKQRNTDLRAMANIYRKCGNKGEEEEVDVAGTRGKNEYRHLLVCRMDAGNC